MTRVTCDGHGHPFSVLEGWHAPAGRRACEPRPLAQDGQIGTAPPVGGPGRAPAPPPPPPPRRKPVKAGREALPHPPPPPTAAKPCKQGRKALPTSSLPNRRGRVLRRPAGWPRADHDWASSAWWM